MNVVDASAVLAVLLEEPVFEAALSEMNGAAISTVNLCEVLTRAIELGGSREGASVLVRRLRLLPQEFTSQQAQRAADLREPTRRLGLSLGDRACLALGLECGGRILTADRAWVKLDLGVDVQLIR